MTFKNMTPKEYQRRWRKKNRKKLRAYQRQWKRNRRKDSKFRRREVNRVITWGQKFRAEHRTKWNADRRRWQAENRKKAVSRLGRVCRFPKCGRTDGLHIHHDHSKQQRLKCCRSGNGCTRCQVCMLCSQHNHMLGMVSDSLRVAKRMVAFLRRYH